MQSMGQGGCESDGQPGRCPRGGLVKTWQLCQCELKPAMMCLVQEHLCIPTTSTAGGRVRGCLSPAGTKLRWASGPGSLCLRPNCRLQAQGFGAGHCPSLYFFFSFYADKVKSEKMIVTQLCPIL